MEKIFVCAGTKLAQSDNINEQATRLGAILAKNGAQYVQGGCKTGVMGLTLMEFIKTSKNVVFFIPDKYYDYDAPELETLVGKENFVAVRLDGEAERLKALKTCDRAIVLPGGTGTLEELLYLNETARSAEHNLKIDVVNIDGYFDGLLQQIQINTRERLTKADELHFNILNSVDELQF